MHHDTVAAAARRFPLLGRPRPDCPALPLRMKEITDAANAALRKPGHGMADAAHVLNKAALIASDAGLPDLARRICWQHIDAYLRLARPLTVLEARYMLEPVFNLARLQIRAEQGAPALRLMEAMHEAVTRHIDLVVGDRTLPTANLVGDRAERRMLRQWVWLQLIGEGTRVLALDGRWDEAAEHARSHNGIGAHLMEGRQAVIIAACLQGDPEYGRRVLTESALTQPWEQQVAACLSLMCATPARPAKPQHLTVLTERLALPITAPNYASYRARLGLAGAILANATQPELATRLLHHTARQAIDTADGYAAHDILGFREPLQGITADQHAALRRIATTAGLGLGELPEEAVRHLTTAADMAVQALAAPAAAAPAAGLGRA
ncbi:hypothetical protein O7628_32425 [Micromonospora sp. WMMD956]|uniref:hypothetical protein n=1 Tax=Micromonospora sp. WMMD956 TaxID=3016108 RepID=UPI002417DD29|nr:hypothetical protein [Micromonospora sp. WMMD956]MDG4820212.1 hypothetical protein [Micromonospora sp. WMMD956]